MLPRLVMLGCVALLVAQQVALPVAAVEAARESLSRPTSLPGHALPPLGRVSAADGDAEISPSDELQSRAGGLPPAPVVPPMRAAVASPGAVVYAAPTVPRRARLISGASPRGPPA